MCKKDLEDEAAKAILSLARDISDVNIEVEVLAYISGPNWEKEIITDSFEIDENENKIRFVYNARNRVWNAMIIAGKVFINEKLGSANLLMVINNGTKCNLGSLEFVFYYGKKKSQKTYQKLICEAIESTPNKKMALSQIYDYFLHNEGFDKNEANTWKNSIRHNLSLNKIFMKLPKERDDMNGKGSFWTIDYTRKDEMKGFINTSPNKYTATKSQDKKNERPIYTSKPIKNKVIKPSFLRRNNLVKNDDHTEDQLSEQSIKLKIYKRPSEVFFNVKVENMKIKNKRKISQSYKNSKRFKFNFAHLNRVAKQEYMNTMPTIESIKPMDKEESIFFVERELKNRRSQSIIELSQEFESLTLFSRKSKDTNKRNYQ